MDRGKQGTKRSTDVDVCDITLGAIAAPADRHDSPLLDETLDTLKTLAPLPHKSVHLDRSYDSETLRQKLKARGLTGVISEKGEPAPLQAGEHWVVERTNSWHSAHKKLLCTPNGGGGSSTSGSPSQTWSS